MDLKTAVLAAASRLANEGEHLPLYVSAKGDILEVGTKQYASRKTAFQVAQRRDAAKWNVYVAARYGSKVVVWSGVDCVMCEGPVSP